MAHGNVTPEAVDARTPLQLGGAWCSEKPVLQASGKLAQIFAQGALSWWLA